MSFDCSSYFPFPKARVVQQRVLDAAKDAYESGFDHVVLSAPTGTGKSAIAVALSNWLNKTRGAQTYGLTSQKVLQEQYCSDFNIPMLKGKANFKCAKDPFGNLKCDAGVCMMLRARGKAITCASACPYIAARDLAYSKPMLVTNYRYFLNMSLAAEIAKHDGKELFHQPRELLVLDEAHRCESELLEFASLSLKSDDFLSFGLGRKFLKLPNPNTSEADLVSWLDDHGLPVLNDKYNRELLELAQMDENDKKTYAQSRKVKFLDTLICMGNRLNSATKAGTPVCAWSGDGTADFKLVFGRSAWDKWLSAYGKYKLSMSATILSKEQHCEELGLDPSKVKYIKCPSPFDVEHRKILAVPVGSMSYSKKEATMPKIVEAVENILSKHADERGIIHCVNYGVASYILSNVSQSSQNRLVYPKGEDRDELIDFFMRQSKHRKDLVLISPSLGEGIDLRGELARFAIICKVPYAGLGDPWVKKRMSMDNMWYSDFASKNLVQMTGRTVRTEDDWATTYVLDDDFVKHVVRNQDRLPQWWLDSVKPADSALIDEITG